MAKLTVPARFDPDVAHPARVYSVWIGGKDHYPADRKVKHFPEFAIWRETTPDRGPASTRTPSS